MCAVKRRAKKTHFKHHHHYKAREAEESLLHQIREPSNYKRDLGFNYVRLAALVLQLKHAICTAISDEVGYLLAQCSFQGLLCAKA